MVIKISQQWKMGPLFSTSVHPGKSLIDSGLLCKALTDVLYNGL